MEIYGAGRRMQPSSPPDSRRDKKYSLMNSIKCEFGHARPATALPPAAAICQIALLGGEEEDPRCMAALRLDRWQGQTVAAVTAANTQLTCANRTTTTQLSL